MTVLHTIGWILRETIKTIGRLARFILTVLIWLALFILKIALVVFTVGLIRM